MYEIPVACKLPVRLADVQGDITIQFSSMAVARKYFHDEHVRQKVEACVLRLFRKTMADQDTAEAESREPRPELWL